MSSQQVYNSNSNKGTAEVSQGTFSLFLEVPALGVASWTVDTTLPVKKQVLYLIGYRIEMASSDAAIATKYVYLNLPFLSPNKLIDNNTGFSYEPILLGPGAVTTVANCRFPVYMSGDAKIKFNVSVTDDTGEPLPVSSLIHASFIFEMSIGSLI